MSAAWPERGAGPGLADRLDRLWREQLTEWPLLARGAASITDAETRAVQVGAAAITLQWNPARAVSAGARIDAASIARRPCFLCNHNRPPEQRAVELDERWWVLCNPAPILAPHHVVISTRHEPQRVAGSIAPLVTLAGDLADGFTAFYNGPTSGASAPDHLHLQAVPSDQLPFERDVLVRLDEPGQVDWRAVGPARIGLTLRPPYRAVLVSAEDRAGLATGIHTALATLAAVAPADPEPALNLFTRVTAGRWLAWLFPRGAHRPARYGHEPGQVLVSPGAIDMAGMLITPRREDFDGLTARDLEEIFTQVSAPDAIWSALGTQLG